MVSCVVHLVLAFLLLHALRENDLRKMWAWLGVRVVVLVTDLLMGVVEAVNEDEQRRYAVCFLSFCLVSVGNVWVVRIFALHVTGGVKDNVKDKITARYKHVQDTSWKHCLLLTSRGTLEPHCYVIRLN
ncbi:uncharacterized protein LOC119579382 isoform X1 [Penaeus monodon]|uniref:uncharacterized protein LOC119579382 isoform X1 n=1 Tax=Penaeus monodon TaxID=6687 RepID=UPI0018A749CB|nr:uncharacterized protein LOC119579382 isoform X1 [Penaeus monodon]